MYRHLSPNSLAEVGIDCEFQLSDGCPRHEVVRYKDIVRTTQNYDGHYKCRKCIRYTGEDVEFFDRDCMATIDSEAKAYFLGWVASFAKVQVQDDQTVVLVAGKEDLDSIGLLQKEMMSSWWLDVDMRNDTVIVTLRCMQIWEDLQMHLKNLPLPVEWMWHFMRGVFERRGKIQCSPPSCRVSELSESVLHHLKTFCSIPCQLQGNDLVYYGTNAIDFLGVLYQQPTSYQLDTQYRAFVTLLQPKTLFRLPECHVYKTCSDAILPSKGKMSDVGYDLTLVRKEKELLGSVTLYDTGIKIRVRHGMYAEVVPRSSLSKSGYMMANSIGIIDPSYNGRIMVALIKVDPSAPDIQLPFRCCQLIFREQSHCSILESANDFEDTARGAGGFGSTG